MYDVFKTVLILSLFGFGITALLLLFKPITAKRLPGKMAILCMGCCADFYVVSGIQADTEKRGSKTFNSAAKSNGAD